MLLHQFKRVKHCHEQGPRPFSLLIKASCFKLHNDSSLARDPLVGLAKVFLGPCKMLQLPNGIHHPRTDCGEAGSSLLLTLSTNRATARSASWGTFGRSLRGLT